jgi:biopolymer transport protein ExbD
VKAHYLAREPGLAIPFVALAINVLLLLAVGAQLHSGSGRLNLSMNDNTAPGAPQISIARDGTISFNGSPMSSTAELEFHLSAISANTKALIIETPPTLPSSRLTEILQLCNRAGFNDIALRMRKDASR